MTSRLALILPLGEITADNSGPWSDSNPIVIQCLKKTELANWISPGSVLSYNPARQKRTSWYLQIVIQPIVRKELVEKLDRESTWLQVCHMISSVSVAFSENGGGGGCDKVIKHLFENSFFSLIHVKDFLWESFWELGRIKKCINSADWSVISCCRIKIFIFTST